MSGPSYDFHLHSCLSPCASEDMTPANIAGFAKLAGLDYIAVTDHNAAGNLPAVQRACRAYGLGFLPGIEVTSAEEIHLLCYFARVDAALEMGRVLYENLPDYPFDPAIWGRQLQMDEDDRLLAQPEKLLPSATALDLYEVKALCESLGGLCIPAHVDKDTTSLLSVLGFAPADIEFPAFEVKRPEHSLEKLVESGRLPPGREILTSSDAHTLEEISEYPRRLAADSALWKLLDALP